MVLLETSRNAVTPSLASVGNERHAQCMDDRWHAYLTGLADHRLGVARRVPEQYKAAAVSDALTEVRGAADALVAAGLISTEDASALVTEIWDGATQELLAAGLVTPVSASAEARLTLRPTRRRRPEEA